MGDDLDAEFARFQAELATVEQAEQTDAAPDLDAELARFQAEIGGAAEQQEDLPPPSVPPPSTLPPPTRPPPQNTAQPVIAAPAQVSAPPQPASTEADLAPPSIPPPPTLHNNTTQPSGSNWAGGHKPPPPPGAPGKKVAIVRTAAGEKWLDPKLAEWPENDFRIFVGNLGNEVNDTMLTQAFQHYPSFQMARVIKNSHNNKPKGYGFVSLGDPADGVKALREMHQKYIGNRPVQLKHSKWEKRNVTDKKGKPRKRVIEDKGRAAGQPDAKRHDSGGILHR